jgi:hypothetical protein
MFRPFSFVQCRHISPRFPRTPAAYASYMRLCPVYYLKLYIVTNKHLSAANYCILN